MLKRQIEDNIRKQLKHFPCVVILGPRQVGKTTLSKSLMPKAKYFDLERSSTNALFTKNAESLLEAHSDDCVLIDEIQRMPTIFPLLRSLIDEKRKPARFILTGSASPEILKGASESLAGRAIYFNLNPLGIMEMPDSITVQQHWLKGGFPTPALLKNAKARYHWMDSFITTYIERDLPFLFDMKFSTITMRKLWTMMAHVNGSILNAESLGRSLDITGTTLKKYLDYLEAAFIIKKLPPFYVNIGKRLVKSPKLYINDSGILHFLLNIHTEKELYSHPAAGNSWESYIISQIQYAKNSRIDMHYYRTQAGTECDLILTNGHEVKACIEIKLSKSPDITRGFYQSIEDLKCKNNFIIGSQTADYTLKNNIKLVDISTFIKKYLPKIK